MEEEDRIWILVARKLAGEATTEELTELEVLLAASPLAQSRIEAFNELWRIKNEGGNHASAIANLLRRIDGLA